MGFDVNQSRLFRRVILVGGLVVVAAGVGSAHRAFSGWGELADEVPGQFAWERVDSPCPGCGTADWLPIAYGLPGEELAAAERRGKVWLGGCMVGYADRYCKLCEREWESLEHQFERSRGALPSPRR